MVSAPACSIHAVWRQVKSWDYNGWEVSFAASIFWLLAPISAVFGRSFERWARNTRQSQDRLTVAYLQASARKQKRGFLLRIKLILTRNFRAHAHPHRYSCAAASALASSRCKAVSPSTAFETYL
eukprot:scaffold3348_cov113-Isochrysis_galbana.AAC.11